MEKKHNIVLLIITIVTVLTTVIGATFAFFAAQVNTGTGATLSTVVEENDVLFTATGSNLTLQITADMMSQHASSAGTIIAGEGSSNVMNVTLTSGTEGAIACYYNIYFEWDNAASAYLTKTTGATKEFTSQLTLTDANHTGSGGTNKFASETQLTDVVTTTGKTLVVEKASIVASASQSGSQTWSPIIKFYNLQLNQTDLAGKSFKGKFTIDDVECGGANSSQVDPNSLSGKVLAKVSDSEYTSSQSNGGVYKVVHETVEYEGQTLDAGVRYAGKDPDNYITFNGETAGWRIIGVFEGSTLGLEPGKQYAKIIRNTKLSTDYSWNNSENDWTNSTLNAYLNGEYLASLSTSDKIAKYNDNYSTWYLRGSNDYYNMYTPEMYVTERVTGQAGYRNGVRYAARAETQAAIGLMYPSDYGYAGYGANCDVYTTALGYYGTKDKDTGIVSGCSKVNYLATESIENDELEWFISPKPDNNYVALVINGGGGLVYYNYVNNAFAVRPVLYLEANLTATGSGTKLDPYVLN